MQNISKCKCVDSDLLSPSEHYGHFVFTSLEQSEGSTIGNMLRRVLLSNLYGLKITGVRLPDVTHNEFNLLDGVREDFLEIMLNLKEIIFKDDNKFGQSYHGLLKIQGPAVVTAGAIKFSKGIKVLNPNNYLLTISDESLVEIHLKLEHGKAYVLAKDQKLEGSTYFLPIDSNFAPVVKVNSYVKTLPQHVENTDVELHLEIFTNGSLLPHQALIQAKNMIGYMLSTINKIEFPCLGELVSDEQVIEKTIDRDIKLKEESTKDLKKDQGRKLKSNTIREEKVLQQKFLVPEVPEKKKEEIIEQVTTPEEMLLKRVNDMDDGSLECLNLSSRIIKALKGANINFTWELMDYDSSGPPYLKDIKGLGPKSIAEIEKNLRIFYEPPF
nr:DNA-directed RNA polymerase subunit alpha [Scytosiphon promiscuus]QDM58306.1 DNA-directed RNA polymerase subunit alpha [Scytosiphon promiscuus]QDM58449.1 DNA-directed RNA polymerase subunit alpha [Scytosiphon promiscuus]QTW91462.1 RNA polymerase alpha subunit [Scytosiphon lomentaria]WAM64544.1 RNA polymerase alpha subunit [Scytosiphon lomentaria]